MKTLRISSSYILAIFVSLSACQAYVERDVRIPALESNVMQAEPQTQNEKSDKLHQDSTKGTPPIFQFIVASDFVVVARAVKTEPIARVNKTETNPNAVNIGDRVAGISQSFAVKDLLQSKNLLWSINEQEKLEEFQIFAPVGDLEEFYQNGHEYLIFLKRISTDENLAAVYELDPAKSYFRSYTGDTSLFGARDGGMHGPSKRGIIEISDAKNQELISTIETLCDALRTPSLQSKIRKLEKLRASSNPVLRDNAIAAISYLKDLKP